MVRRPGLDLLRAAAIALVLFYHAGVFGLVSTDHWVVAFGWMGVDLFFALSGFLIAGQLLRPWASGRRPDHRRFFLRRILRTLPAYLVVLLIYLALPAVRETRPMQPPWQFLTFTQNLLVRLPPARAFSQVWSLCVEEQFYLVLPLVLVLLARRPSPARTMSALVGVLLLGMVVRLGLWLHIRHGFFPAYWELVYYPTWSRLDDLLAGVAAATVQHLRPAAWARLTARPNGPLAAGLALVVLAAWLFGSRFESLPTMLFGYPLLAAGMAMLVVAGADGCSLIGRAALPGARALATGAYGIYLSHKLVFHAVQAWLVPRLALAPETAFVAALGGSIAVGGLLHRLVERPFLRLRDALDGQPRPR